MSHRGIALLQGLAQMDGKTFNGTIKELKESITLNEITELFSLVNDMLRQLVSLSYLHERDEMYLLLGFYYMALRNPEGWKNEVLDSLDEDGYKVAKKWNRFIENHRESYQCILPLFENPEYSDEIRKLRNYVEHSKYYIKHDKSVMELYSEYYTKFFGYSNKFRRSVLFSLEVIFGRYAIEPVIVFDDASNVVLVDEEYAKKHRMKKYTRCRENTYKCMVTVQSRRNLCIQILNF